MRAVPARGDGGQGVAGRTAAQGRPSRNPIEVEPKPGMFPVFKGDVMRWCDEKTWKRLENQGWEKEAAGAAAPSSTEVDPPSTRRNWRKS